HTLEQLAKKLAASSIKTGRSTTLEPMNPYERRIIHATVSEIEGVASTSVGEEPNRCVVISSTSPRPQQAARVADDRRPVRRDEPSRGPRPAPRREFAPRPAPVPPVFEPSQAERPAPVPPVSELPQAERPAPMRAPEGERPAAAAEGRFPRREDSRPPRRDDRRSGGRDDRRGGRREKPEPYQVTGEREVAPTEGADTPLYGKIEL
ncbi:MAG: R3H domain-containing nucleic acid-binding protein, partial [Oscillospiraceae bacterium]